MSYGHEQQFVGNATNVLDNFLVEHKIISYEYWHTELGIILLLGSLLAPFAQGQCYLLIRNQTRGHSFQGLIGSLRGALKHQDECILGRCPIAHHFS